MKGSEPKRMIDPLDFNIETVPERIKRAGDLFEPVLSDKQNIFAHAPVEDGKAA